MTSVKFLVLLMLIIPTVSVMGTVLSSAEVSGPYSVGVLQDGVYQAASIGESLKGATDGLMAKEIRILTEILRGLRITDRYEALEDLEHMRRSVARNV